MRIKLPIYYNTEETDHLFKGGIDADLSKCEIRQRIFYHIDSIGQHYDDYKPTNHTQIYSGGNSFTCALSVDEVDRLITKEMLIYS